MTTRRLLAALALSIGLLGGMAEHACAQPTPGIRLGLGGQLGEPSGLSLKFYQQPGLAWDFLLAFDLNDDFVFLNVHRVWERPIQTTPLRYYYGFGGFIGLREHPDDEEAVFGVSFTIGLNYFIERFEIFANLTPRLAIVPGTDGELGGGLGLRYYF